MKIVIDISQIAYQGSGVANYTAELTANLLSLDKKNSYCLFGYGLRSLETLRAFCRNLPKHPHVEKMLLPFPQSLVSFWGNTLHKINLENLLGNFDLYHSSDWIQFPSQAIKVTTIHDLVVYRYPETSAASIIRQQKKRLEHVKREADLILADSQSTKRDVENILGLPKEKIVIVYPGIKSEFSQKTDNQVKQIRDKYGITRKYFITVGTLEPRKNLKTTLAAFSLFRLKHWQKENRADLVVIGKKGWSADAAAGEDVKVLGLISDKDLAVLYSGAKGLIFPSLYEGFGLTVAEAMASGCPVITSSRGSLKEVGGEAVLYADPENPKNISEKIYRLLSEDKLRNKLTEKGLQQAEKFSWRKTAAEILLNYEELYRKRHKL